MSTILPDILKRDRASVVSGLAGVLRRSVPHAFKRGGQCQFVSLDMESAENRYRLEPTDHLSAETIFEARWALTLVERAMAVLRRNTLAGAKN